MRRIAVTALMGLLLGAAGCQTMSTSGQPAAARADGAPTLIGTVGGRLLSHGVGQDLDEHDRQIIAEALDDGSDGETRAWSNSDTGKRYRVTPQETFMIEGWHCRRFSLRTEGHSISETACRTDDGNWATTRRWGVD